MKAMIIAATGALSLYAGVQLADTILPEASATAAQAQGIVIADAAYYDHLLNGTPWPQALERAVADTRNGSDQLTVDGTTVIWNAGTSIWCISLPEPESTVNPVDCSQ